MRSLAMGFAALILLLPVNSHALGLGEIELHSALNQPLDAEISLLSADSINPQELKVELASNAAFAQAEIERPVFLTKIKFEINNKSDGRLYIKVTSDDSIREPFLDFLIEVNWPNGRLLREYTLLLDPPVLLDDKPVPVEAARTSVSPQREQDIPSDGKAANSTSAKSRATQQTATQIQQSTGELQYGPVTTTDTLWSIASQLRPNKSVTVQQVMMALLISNPDAFYNNNINDLKAGYVLRISDPDLLTAMSQDEALRESQIQYQQWLDAKQNAGQAPGSRPVGAGLPSNTFPATTSTGEMSSGAKLKLVAPVIGEDASAARSSQSMGTQAELDSLREELAIALESSDVTRQENDELRARITAMEEQLASMQRLVTLKDDTMAAIQGGMEQPDSEIQAMDSIEEAVPPDETSVPEMNQQPAPPPAAVPPPPPAEEGAINMLLKDPLTLGLGGLVIVVVIVLIWMKMRQRQLASDGFEEGILAAAEQVGDESSSAMMGAMGNYAAEASMDAIETDTDEMDVLAEADVYLAYRRFDKAIELLNEALRNEPDRSDYKLKLMEVYAESENIDGFVAQAEQFYAAVGQQGGPAWDKVVRLGRKLTPEHPLFSGGENHNATNMAEYESEAPAENIFAGDSEYSGSIADESEGEPARIFESNRTDLINDGTEDDHVNDGLSFDFSDEAESDADSTVTEDLSSETTANKVEEPVAEDKSNIIDFETGLLPPEEKRDQASDEEDDSRVPENSSNTIEFESGLGLDQASRENKKEDKKNSLSDDNEDLELNDDLEWLSNIDDDISLDDSSLEDAAENHILIATGDEVDTKLDLAKAYIDMDDKESARGILDEVVQEGNEEQKREAEELIQQIS